jgi:ribose transport system ATP-binding protein
VPVAVIALLLVALGGYAQAKSSLFLQSGNLSGLLTLALPLLVVALGQQVALMSGGFDISVGSTMSLIVVIASYEVTQSTLVASMPGILLCLAAGAAVGLLNGLVVRGLKISPIIATIAMYGALQGLAILLREQPGGQIGQGLTNFVGGQIGWIPIPFLAFVAIAVLAEVWLFSTSAGLTFRATGLAEEPSRRNGIEVTRIKLAGYLTAAVGAAIAGLLLAAQVGLGANDAGTGFTLPAFTVCFLAGASLAGGRGSFVGVVLGALFLSTITNVTPLLNLPDATSQVVTGALTILAVLAYAFTDRQRPRKS